MAKLANFIKVVFMWILGFIIAGYIFCAAIFYVLPYITGIPVDTGKYVINAARRIDGMNERRAETPGLGEIVVNGLNNTVDYLLQFVVQKEE